LKEKDLQYYEDLEKKEEEKLQKRNERKQKREEKRNVSIISQFVSTPLYFWVKSREMFVMSTVKGTILSEILTFLSVAVRFLRSTFAEYFTLLI